MPELLWSRACFKYKIQSMTNETINNILTRTSIRVFDQNRPLPADTFDILTRAAMSAPTGVDRRPWDFVVVTDRDVLEALAKNLPYCKMAAQAQGAIVCCGDSSRFLDGDDSTLWVQDLSAASENILIAAHALGLGAVWTAVYPHPDREQTVRSILGIPADIIPFNIIPVGYPTHDYQPRDKYDATRIHRERW